MKKGVDCFRTTSGGIEHLAGNGGIMFDGLRQVRGAVTIEVVVEVI